MDAQQSTFHMLFRRDLLQNSEDDHLFSDEQIALLEDMKASGANEEIIKRKVM